MAFVRDPLYILMQDGYTNISDPNLNHRTMSIPQLLFDEIVVMRFFNMTYDETKAAFDRVLETQFETGADGVRKANGLPTVMERAHAEATLQRQASGNTPPKTVWDRFRELGTKIRRDDHTPG